MAEKKTKEKVKETVTAVPKMYIGPSIRKYGLIPGTIYTGFTGNVEAAVKEYPEITSLFVAVDKDFVKNKEKIKTKGTKENLILKRLVKKVGGNQ